MSKYLLYALILALVATLIIFLTPSVVSYERTPDITVAEAIEHIEVEPVTQIVTLRPELVPICSCESMQGKYGTPTHYEADGVTVLRGRVNPKDIGMCQISETYWLDLSNQLGYNIYTEDGNILMANYIYDNYGKQPWQWSKKCWE